MTGWSTEEGDKCGEWLPSALRGGVAVYRALPWRATQKSHQRPKFAPERNETVTKVGNLTQSVSGILKLHSGGQVEIVD